MYIWVYPVKSFMETQSVENGHPACKSGKKLHCSSFWHEAESTETSILYCNTWETSSGGTIVSKCELCLNRFASGQK